MHNLKFVLIDPGHFQFRTLNCRCLMCYGYYVASGLKYALFLSSPSPDSGRFILLTNIKANDMSVNGHFSLPGSAVKCHSIYSLYFWVGYLMLLSVSRLYIIGPHVSVIYLCMELIVSVHCFWTMMFKAHFWTPCCELCLGNKYSFSFKPFCIYLMCFKYCVRLLPLMQLRAKTKCVN